MCYLFQFRNVWEHCTAQILLLHEDTCLLSRSRNYGSRITKPYLLAHHVADPVLQLSQQRQFLIHVAFSVFNSQLQILSSVLDEQLLCRALATDPDLDPKGWGHPRPIDAAQRHFSTCTSALHTAHVLHSFPLIIPH